MIGTSNIIGAIPKNKRGINNAAEGIPEIMTGVNNIICPIPKNKIGGNNAVDGVPKIQDDIKRLFDAINAIFIGLKYDYYGFKKSEILLFSFIIVIEIMIDTIKKLINLIRLLWKPWFNRFHNYLYQNKHSITFSYLIDKNQGD